MAERFAYSAGTISITSNSSTVIGTGTAFRGHDRAGSIIYALPAAAVPIVVGVVAEVTPRGIYDNLQLPLAAQYKGATLTNVPYVIVDGPAIANGATQAAIYARYAAFLEQSMGLVGDSADTVDLSIVPENSFFVDSVNKKFFQWRNGVLQELFGVAQGTSSFLAHKNAIDQAGLASGSVTNIITFGTELYDAGAFFSGNAWTPPAGKIELAGAAFLTGTWTAGIQINLSIHKNGVQLRTASIFPASTSNAHGIVTVDDIASGTDVYDLRVTIIASVGTYTVKGFTDSTFFCGHVLSQQGAAGANGADGRDPGVLLTWDGATADADPGTGDIRADNLSLPSATQLFVSKTSRGGSAIATFLNALDDSTNPSPKGTLVLTRTTDNAQATFNITGVTDATNYVKVAVSGHSGATSFVAANPISFQFSRSGDQGAAGSTGSPGATGPAAALEWLFSTITTDADPGIGNVRFNNATFGSVTQIFFDNAERGGTDVTVWLDSFDDSTSTSDRGFVVLIDVVDPTDFALFRVTGAVVDGTGYRKVPVTPLVQSGSFLTGERVSVLFARTGNQGAAGVAGAPGATGADGRDPGVLLTWDTATADADPGAGKIRGNNASLPSATQLFVSKTNRAGSDIAVFLNALDDSSNPVLKGTLVLTRATDNVQAIFSITGVTDAVGYVKVAVSGHSGATSFAALNPISFQFSRAGNLGATGSTGASGPGYLATSTTSLLIGTGPKSFTTQAGLAYTVGARARASSAGASTNFMEGLVTAYSGTTLSINVTLIGGSGTAADWNINLSGEQGNTGVTGATGPTTTLEWLFSTTTADADPGTGNLRFNNATFASITQLFFDNSERIGTDVSSWLDSFDDSTTSGNKGTLTIRDVVDSTKFAIFQVTGAVVDGTGYRKVPVTPINSGGLSLANGARVSVAFSRAGDLGATGTTGPTGPGYAATSTTSFLIGIGSKAFTTQAGLAYTVGARVRASSAANTANFMEGLVTAYSGTTLTINVTLIGGSGTLADWNINLSGEQGNTGNTGAVGPTSVLEWLFSTTITDADPGIGNVRANNTTFASVTQLFFDNNERNATDVSTFLTAWDDSTTVGNKGFLVAVKVLDPTKFAIFQVTGTVVDGIGYRKVPVTPIVHFGFPWTDADRISWQFARTGDKGADGTGAVAVGTVTLDFGAFPGSTDASVAVTGQAGIIPGSLAQARIWPVATADHSVGEHLVDAPIVTAGAIVAGTGFTITGTARDGNPVYGAWTVAWAWSS
jgi:hypothetical protein